VGRLDILDDFWAPLDPTPDTPRNEAWIEFQERVAYVRQHLGGFGPEGELDPRAEVYLTLGTPPRIVFERDPSNESLRDDPDRDAYHDFALFLDSYLDGSRLVSGAPDVGGAPSSPAAGARAKFNRADTRVAGPGRNQETGRFPGSHVFPLEGWYEPRLAGHSRANAFRPEPVAELWIYEHGGFPLFGSAWSDSARRTFHFAYDPRRGRYELREVREVRERGLDD
jgi:GWxTD domain-containing protein